MTSRKPTTGPSEDLKHLMNSYGEYFIQEFGEHFESLPEELNESRDYVLSVPIEYSDLKKYPHIADSLVDDVLKSVDIACTVMNDRSRELNEVEYRLRPRLVGLPENKERTIDSLRMRDRSKFFSFECMVSHVNPVMGYIKSAGYTCRDCGVELKIPQKIARERRKPRFCMSCVEIAIEKDGAPPPHPPGWLELDIENCEYEDIQYVELTNWVPRPERPAPDPISKIDAILDDELVATLKEGQFVKVNAVVEVDHLPGRDYIKDTRRLLILRVLSVEKLEGLEYQSRVEMFEMLRLEELGSDQEIRGQVDFEDI